MSQGAKLDFLWTGKMPAAHPSSDNLPLCLAARASVPLPPLEGHPGADPARGLQQRQGLPAPEELGLPQQRGSLVSIPDPLQSQHTLGVTPSTSGGTQASSPFSPWLGQSLLAAALAVVIPVLVALGSRCFLHESSLESFPL